MIFLNMLKRIFVAMLVSALLVSSVMLNAWVRAAPPTQEPELNPVAPGPMTSTILIFNPDTSGAAAVKLDIYDASGAVAHTTTINVAANGMKAVTLPGSLGANFQGGAQISSDKNVQAIVVGANANKTARDSYEGTIAPALDVTLPLVRHLAANTQNTILAIQNTTANAANVTITFYGIDGIQAAQENLNLAAHQSSYLNTNTLFTANTFVGSARIISNQNVAVAAQTSYFKDTAAFDGTNTNQSATTLWLNQADRKINNKDLSVNWSEIFVRNNGTAETDVTLDFYSLTGTPIASFTENAVPANGTAQFLLNTDAFSALGKAYSGWAKISSSGEPLTATTLHVLNKGKRMFSVNGLAPDALGKRFVCGDTARMGTQNSRISILNTDAALTAKMVIRLHDKETGAKLAQTKVNVPPNTTTTVLLSDTKFAAAGTDYQGMTFLQAKGVNAPQVVITVSNPYGSSKLTGTTGYMCTKLL